MMGIKITVVITDNRGFGCINRLQMATGGAEFNNLLDHAVHAHPSHIDFAAHAISLGAEAHRAISIADLENDLKRARESTKPTVIVINTDPYPSTEAGGHWWDVGVPEVSERKQVREARKRHETMRAAQRAAD
jgi:3D-(3,5/4)-trihydroxycyclohexane-1,2-dione acylhydrolase (decyclizing)